MRLIRTLLLLPALAILPSTASAQNFFEELFGIGRAAKPPVPPRGVPGGAPPQPAALPPGEAPPGDPSAMAQPTAPPVPRQPVVLKVPAEDNVFGQELMLNGLAGSLKIERSGASVAANVTLPGTKISQPTETCSVKLNGGSPITLSSAGKPDGVARYEAGAAECPLRFDVLDGSVLATPIGGSKVCTFSAADCATTPSGLWGPTAAGLIPRSSDFDSARGVADKAVRDNYKVLSQRVGRDGIRPVVQEQAAFSSDREELCRTYAREGSHGFCNLRFTEARAIGLAARLGANLGSTTASVTPKPKRKPQSVDGMNPEATGPSAGAAFAD